MRMISFKSKPKYPNVQASFFDDIEFDEWAAAVSLDHDETTLISQSCSLIDHWTLQDMNNSLQFYWVWPSLRWPLVKTWIDGLKTWRDKSRLLLPKLSPKPLCDDVRLNLIQNLIAFTTINGQPGLVNILDGNIWRYVCHWVGRI